MKLWDEMRQVLSLYLCYDPPAGLTGSPEMQQVVDSVLQDTIPGIGRHEVLIMAQDLGATTLMRHILDNMWESVDEPPRKRR
jgi:hypothetical protein